MKKSGEAVAVDDVICFVVRHYNLAVAFYGDFGEALFFAVPIGQRYEFAERDVLMIGVAREDVVGSKGLIYKVFIKGLGGGCVRREEENGGEEKGD